MTARTWIGGPTGSLSLDTNWTPNGIPTAADDVTITGAKIYEVYGPGTSGTLTVLDSLLLYGSISTGTLFIGTASVDSGITLVGGATLSASSAKVLRGGVAAAAAGTKLTVAGAMTLGVAGVSTAADVISRGGGFIQLGGLSMMAYSTQIYVDSTSILEVGTQGGAAVGKLTVDAGFLVSGRGTLLAASGIFNQGIILAQGGTLTLASDVGGTGLLEIGAGATLSLANSRWTEAVVFVGAGGTLGLQTYFGGGPISGFTTGDAIYYGGALPIAVATYRAGSAGLGTLTLSSGNRTIGALTLAGDYTGFIFLVTPGAGPGQDIVAIPTPRTTSGAAPTGTAAPDALIWAGAATGGNWGDTPNWTDTTTGQSPASAPAGSNNAVTLIGPVGSQFQVVNGPGNASSLTVLGNTVLNGTFNTGALKIGTGAGPSATAGWLDLVAGAVVNASSATIVAGTLQLSGAGARLAVAGALGLGAGQSNTTSLVVSNGASLQARSIAITPEPGSSLATSIVNADATSTIEVGTLGGAAAGTITIDAGNVLSGAGSILAANGIVDNGTILVQGGTMVLSDRVTGTGQLQIGAGATLSLQNKGAPDTPNMAFVGSGGTLQLYEVQASGSGSASTSTLNTSGVVSGFAPGDTIQLITSTYRGILNYLNYTPNGSDGGTLSVSSSLSILTISLAGNYTGATFKLTGASITVSIPNTDPLFDTAYYLAQNPDVASSGADPYQQYMSVGWKQGRNPSALFSTIYYLNQNPDVRAAGVNPLTHFEGNGWTEARDPSPGFSVSAYLTAYGDVRTAGIDPLVHYVQNGRAEGRTAFAATPHDTGPHDPLVDNATVYAGNPTVAAAGLDASAWFNSVGWTQGANPDAYFDTNYYLAQNQDVRAAGIDPLTHFEASGWTEGRQPSLAFDDAKYLAAYPDIRAAGLDPLQHYLSTGQFEGRMAFLTGGLQAADPLVNATYYDRQLGATIIPGGTAGAQQAAYAYDHGGWQAGLNPDAFFDTNYYLSHNPDVAAAHIDPLAHYEATGWQEGRDPSAAFSTNKYLAAYADVRAAGIDPLLHYVVNGQAEGRTAFAV